MSARNQLILAILTGFVTLAPPSVAQDIIAGYTVAQRWCASCHEIEKGRFRDEGVPSFAVIAGRPRTTTMSLDGVLSTPHHRMPGYLMRQEIADVSAYIVSLK